MSQRVRDIDEYFSRLLSDAEALAANEWEVRFVMDIRDKYDEYEDDMFVSDAQLSTLRKIAEWD